MYMASCAHHTQHTDNRAASEPPVVKFQYSACTTAQRIECRHGSVQHTHQMLLAAFIAPILALHPVAAVSPAEELTGALEVLSALSALSRPMPDACLLVPLLLLALLM